MKASVQGLKYSTKFILEARKDKVSKVPIIENVPIIMSITFNSTRVFYTIGIRTDKKIWTTEKGISFQDRNTFNQDGTSAAIINASMRNHAVAVDKIFSRLENYPTKTQLRELLNKELNKSTSPKGKKDSMFDYFDDYIEHKRPEVSNYRIIQLTTVKNHLTKFAKEKGLKLTLDKMSPAILSEFDRYLRTDDEQPRSQNTITGILKRFKAFINYSVQQTWTQNNPFVNFKIVKEVYGNPIYLTKEELDILFNKEIESERLSRVRDMFCLQCMIGTRIGDYVRLKHDNIIDGTIQYVPSKTAKETAEECIIPLTNRAWSIINKYNIPGGDLVPYISGQKYNEYLKDLFAFCDLNRTVARLNPVTGKTEIVSLDKIASSHMARRTFIGILFKSTKNEVISSMSGHVQGSRAFTRYYAITQKERVDAIKNLE